MVDYYGSKCSTVNKCTELNHCCGTATPKSNDAGVTTGEITGLCHLEEENIFIDSFLTPYKFACGAHKILATAATILAASYLM